MPNEPAKTIAGSPGVLFEQARLKLLHRSRQFRSVWAEKGVQGVVDRLQRGVLARFVSTTAPLPVQPSDILACDLSSVRSWPVPPLDTQQPITINWVTTPPARGSGGHTTMFRLIQHFQQSGHRCRVYLYDANGGDGAYYASTVRDVFPAFKGEIGDVAGGMDEAHAVVATSWQTAYPVYRARSAGKRFYLVQDFEPWFYPIGGQSILAENTYRMGFHAITAGRFLAGKLRAEYGMAADLFDFGCDTQTYRILPDSAGRNGIVFYAKPEVPRRAFELGLMALRLFHERRPDVTIHFYGSKISRQAFPFVDHGVVSPNELNQIYNQCRAGMSLSMTNVSLVPHEMLAAGCIPVLNDAEHNRIVLDNAFARYAAPNPHALAAALEDIVSTANFPALSAAASTSVSSASWGAAGIAVEKAIRSAVLQA